MRSLNSGPSLRKQINLYLDNELPNDERQNFISKLQTDAVSREKLENEIVFRDYVKCNVKRPAVSPDFIQNLKDRIRIH